MEELYDLAVDPDEVNNLAADTRHASKLEELRLQLDKWIIESGDQGAVMEDPVDVHKGLNRRRLETASRPASAPERR